MRNRHQTPLSGLESHIMRVIWERQQVTAEDVRITLAEERDLKDSTVRTILRRLELKGYINHVLEGRTYIYSPRVDSTSVAAQAVRSIIDRFCGGSVEALLVGMVDNELVAPDKLQQLADRIRRAESAKTKLKKGRSR